MARRQRVTLEGGAELLAQLGRIERSIRGPILTEATESGAEILEEGAREIAPRGQTGLLSSEQGIAKAQTVEEETAAEFIVGPTKDAFYGRFVELGTIYADAQPYLRPTYDQEKPNVVKEVGEVLRKEIRRSGGLR